VANLKLCFNIVRGHDEKTATKLPFIKIDGNFQFFLGLAQAARHLETENAMKSLSNNVGGGGGGGPRITHVSKLSLAFHRPFL
jgi:hypothetical protein